jgi:hypothetical protein
VRRLWVDPSHHGILRTVLATNLALAMRLDLAPSGLLVLPHLAQHPPVLELVHRRKE